MSHFVFRLFENLNVEEDDPSRFNLEIMVNRGAVTNPTEIKSVIGHTIPINLDNYIEINKKLNLEKIDTFLKNLSTLELVKPYSNIEKKSEKKKQNKESESEVVDKISPFKDGQLNEIVSPLL